MKSRLTLCFLLAASWAGAAEVEFATKPAVTKAGDKVKVTFAVSKPTDVEVAVLSAKEAVVRHLAAGVIGGKNPPPKPLRAGLSQTLEWDGKTDLGGKATGGPFKVRVRIGTQVKFGGIIGERSAIGNKVYGLATDDKGQVYVATGSGVKGTVPSIKVFDRKGEYVRTIMPYPATLKPEEVAGFGKARLRDGKLAPPQFHQLTPLIYPASVAGFIGNKVQNGVLWLSSSRGQICAIRASNGACVKWGGGKSPAPPHQGPICWGVAPDGKTLYLAGWYWWTKTRKKVLDGTIYKVDPASGERTEFVKVDVPPKSYWLVEGNGWYHYTNWGRKNGMSAIHGLAVDKEGRVYACDRVNQRIAVYDPTGRLLGSTKIEWPDHIALSPNGPEIYVTTRKVVDGYKAVNEVKVIKLSGWKDGKVLAELTLAGFNASSMAVDATAEPAVIWLSNVAQEKPRKGRPPKVKGILRIEERGKEFVVAGILGESAAGMPVGVVKVWADPRSNDIVVSDGWSGLNRLDGLTGEAKPFPIKGMDLCFGSDGHLYVYGQKGWHELVTRFNRNFKPVPFAATSKRTTTLTTTGKDVYGRYGWGWCNKGIYAGPRGRIYVYNMYDWAKYFVNVWDETGKAEKHGRVADGLLGPLDAQGGGIRVDFAGNIYVGLHGLPRNYPGRSRRMGAVVKFPPTGGGYVKKPGDAPGIPWKGGLMGFVEGAVTAYPELGPQVDRGCVCKEARFDLDGWGRVYIPNGLDYCVKIVDNAGNEIAKFGYYGNPDSRGPESVVPDPEIGLGWPVSVSAGQLHKGRLYVADTLNRRVVRVDVKHAAEETLSIDP